jgi:hypothetical protein
MARKEPDGHKQRTSRTRNPRSPQEFIAKSRELVKQAKNSAMVYAETIEMSKNLRAVRSLEKRSSNGGTARQDTFGTEH